MVRQARQWCESGVYHVVLRGINRVCQGDGVVDTLISANIRITEKGSREVSFLLHNKKGIMYQ